MVHRKIANAFSTNSKFLFCNGYKKVTLFKTGPARCLNSAGECCIAHGYFCRMSQVKSGVGNTRRTEYHSQLTDTSDTRPDRPAFWPQDLLFGAHGEFKIRYYRLSDDLMSCSIYSMHACRLADENEDNIGKIGFGEKDKYVDEFVVISEDENTYVNE